MRRNKLLTLIGSVGLVLVLAVMPFMAACPAPAPPEEEAPPPPEEEAPLPPEGKPTSTKVYHWNFFSTAPASHLLYQEWKVMADLVEQATGGSLKIELFALGEHPYDTGAMLTAVRDGDAQIVDIWGNFMSGAEPALCVTDLPLLSPEPSGLRPVFDKLASEVYKPIWDRWNAECLLPFNFRPMQYLGDEPIESMNGLKGKKIRAWSPELAKWVEILGGTPVTMPFSEALSGFATGLAQGVVGGLSSTYAIGYFDFLKVVQMWEWGYSQCFVLFNKEALAELDEVTRATLLSVVEEYKPRVQSDLIQDEDTALRLTVVEYGVTVYPVSQTLRSEVREKCEMLIWKTWLERAGVEGQQAYDMILAEMK